MELYAEKQDTLFHSLPKMLEMIINLHVPLQLNEKHQFV